ncbi:hypothetical protein PVAP13_9KG266913 [Panicum virgatum]|uniref:Uncharacterized protein n=1 Tax=Panicum virgatum TaxID=38727 RepID=A0A8T0NKN2_PANVG|nr:hypothetical protein PVAP13_9KG266913 [Panicum virgatum]
MYPFGWSPVGSPATERHGHGAAWSRPPLGQFRPSLRYSAIAKHPAQTRRKTSS